MPDGAGSDPEICTNPSPSATNQPQKAIAAEGENDKAKDDNVNKTETALPLTNTLAAKNNLPLTKLGKKKKKSWHNDAYQNEERISPKQAIKTKEFYILWLTRY